MRPGADWSVKGWLVSPGAGDTNHPFFSNLGTDGARKPDNVPRKKREKFPAISLLSPKEETMQ